MEWEERLSQQRVSSETAFRELLEGQEVGQRSWFGFEVNTGVCRNPCVFHDHGPQPEKSPTWPPPLEEELYQCRLCGDEMIGEDIDTHMCMYIKNAMEEDDE